MPEGDSVYRTARRLDRGLAGHELAASDFRVPQHATADLTGRTVLGTETHGKHLLTRFDDGRTLHSHLGMDGSWTVARPGRGLARRHVDQLRVSLRATTGETAYGVALKVVELLPTAVENRVVGHLGPDPLRADWDADEAVRRLAADPDRPLAEALLDQTRLAGLGNLWVNEICFLRGHSPWTPVRDVDLAATVALGVKALRRSIAARGNGQVTTGDPRPGEEHWVYRRTGRDCRRCGTRLKYVPDAPGDAARRATWWCPQCQPGPAPG